MSLSPSYDRPRLYDGDPALSWWPMSAITSTTKSSLQDKMRQGFTGNTENTENSRNIEFISLNILKVQMDRIIQSSDNHENMV